MTAMTKQPTPAAESDAPSYAQGLGDESSVWFKLSPLLKAGVDNPLHILMQMAERYGPVIPINLANQRILLLSDPEDFKHLLVTKADSYSKYFDGLKPIFGKSMITNDGALWQKIRMPQQAAFHPDMFAEYIPYFLAAIRTKMDIWSEIAKTGETIEMVEQTWTLAADMICKALFDRDMPFNPHFVFKCVKTYTDVMNHKEIRLRRQAGEIFEITEEDAAKAMEAWASVPPAVLAADPREERERTLLKMIEAVVADPSVPEFDQQQAIDEIKQYLWAGTETTALTLAWALYETARHPEAAERIRKEGEEVYGDREPTAADYSALAYTRALIQETMRIYPPVWGLIRVANEHDVIGGKEIRPGDRVVIFSYGAHHNPKFWDEPEEFRPERWMAGAAKKQVKYSYLPFGGGKRACIGGAMSQVENTLALSLLLRRFRPEYVGPEPAGINATVTLTPKGGLKFKIRELSHRRDALPAAAPVSPDRACSEGVGEHLKRPEEHHLLYENKQMFLNSERVLREALKNQANAMREGAQAIAHVLTAEPRSPGERVHTFREALGKDALEALSRLAKTYENEISQTEGAIALVKDLLRDCERATELAEQIKDIHQTITDERAEEKRGQEALNITRKARTLLANIDLSRAEAGSLANIETNLTGVVRLARHLLNEAGQRRNSA